MAYLRGRSFDPNPEFARTLRSNETTVTDFTVNTDIGQEGQEAFDRATQTLKKVLLLGAVCVGALYIADKLK